MRVEARAQRFPTEDVEKIKQALLNIFPEGEVEVLDKEVRLRSESAEKLKEILRNLRIRDTARHVLRSGRRGDVTEFRINKQVAYMGKVSFVESPVALGPIDVLIEDEDIEDVIDDIAPSTVEVEE